MQAQEKRKETTIDIRAERHALVALLHPPQPFEWAKLLKRMEPETLPSELLYERFNHDSLEIENALQLSEGRIARWEADGTRFLTYLDNDYPNQLRDVFDFPPFIFSRGKLLNGGASERGVSLVGSREASGWALRATRNIAAGLVRDDITVVAGLAAGIDAAAHETALSLHGRTVGVIGTGIWRQYPQSSARLQKAMETEGLVISQFWPDTPPSKISFPMRNAVMSAYSMVTVIIQAHEKSGTRHQAARAVRHGRPLIISDFVASETTWGRKLAEEKTLDVTVVSGESEALREAIKCTRRFEPGHLMPALKAQ